MLTPSTDIYELMGMGICGFVGVVSCIFDFAKE
jgi:hypothetical protein